MVSASAMRVAVCGIWIAALCGGALADDKSGYTLLNPTPRNLMREMTTDRPDITEVPFTVDAGHFQTESTLFGYIRSRPMPMAPSPMAMSSPTPTCASVSPTTSSSVSYGCLTGY